MHVKRLSRSSLPPFLGRARFAWLALLVGILLQAGAARADSLTLGSSVAALNGPWRFHTGDDASWADPQFDASAWELVDLTPPPGAHDADVGLTGYVPGWQARGHRGYLGYAWYRTRICISSPPVAGLALSGPPYVDSAYQAFVNGRMVGEFGDFSTPTPNAYGIHRPKFFALRASDRSSSAGENVVVIAIRVWMGPWALRDLQSGGIHIAPSLGTLDGALARYQAQRWETIRGYLVDGIEAGIFILLALMSLSLIPFDRTNSTYRWLAAALVFLGIARANQTALFCFEFESVHGFELITLVLMVPLSLGAWTMAWYTWTRPRNRAWLPAVAGVLTLLLLGLEILRRSWFYGTFPPLLVASLGYASMTVRFMFLALTLLIMAQALMKRSRERWLVLAASLSISVGLFAQELSMAHLKGIWFPFGVGVSRTEYAYACFDVAVVALLLHRLYSHRLKPQSSAAT